MKKVLFCLNELATWGSQPLSSELNAAVRLHNKGKHSKSVSFVRECGIECFDSRRIRKSPAVALFGGLGLLVEGIRDAESVNHLSIAEVFGVENGATESMGCGDNGGIPMG